MINISNIFGDDYDEFIQTESILFEVLEISQSDMLNFEIKHSGSWNMHVVVMFSEYTENFDIFSNLNLPAMKMVSPFIIFGLLLFLGIAISIIGIIVMLADLKNDKDAKRNY